MAILVVDFWISEPSLREKKPPTNALIPLNYQLYAPQKKHKKTHPGRRFPHPFAPEIPRRWICLPKTLKWISAGICRSKAWRPVMFTNNSGLPVVKCTVMSVFGSKPSWMDTTEMANVHILNKSCVYVNINMFNKYKLYQTNYMIKIRSNFQWYTAGISCTAISTCAFCENVLDFSLHLKVREEIAKTILYGRQPGSGTLPLAPKKHTPSTITWWFQPSWKILLVKFVHLLKEWEVKHM